MHSNKDTKPMKREPVSFTEPPQSLNFHKVMYWHPQSKELLRKKDNGDTTAATMLSKARKFLEFKCIVKKSNCRWECLPIEGYNKTIYTVVCVEDGFICNCQGFFKNKYCSHILAVEQYEYIEEYNQKVSE